jgi:hypothetical protein
MELNPRLRIPQRGGRRSALRPSHPEIRLREIKLAFLGDEFPRLASTPSIVSRLQQACKYSPGAAKGKREFIPIHAMSQFRKLSSAIIYRRASVSPTQSVSPLRRRANVQTYPAKRNELCTFSPLAQAMRSKRLSIPPPMLIPAYPGILPDFLVSARA